MQLFKEQGNNPKRHAQRNLIGRTHYVDDDTLRFHKSRIVSARVVDQGLLFAIVTSDALDYENTKRGFRYVVFNIFGTVISRVELDDAFKTSAQATKAMWAYLNTVDAKGHTLDAIDKHARQQATELNELIGTVNKLIEAKAA